MDIIGYSTLFCVYLKSLMKKYLTNQGFLWHPEHGHIMLYGHDGLKNI